MYFVCCFYLVAAADSYSPAAAPYVALTGQGLAVVLVAYESAIISDELILCQELEGSHRYDVEQQMAFMLHTTSDQSFILMLNNNSIPYYCWQSKHRN